MRGSKWEVRAAGSMEETIPILTCIDQIDTFLNQSLLNIHPTYGARGSSIIL